MQWKLNLKNSVWWKKHWKSLAIVAILAVSLPLTVPLARRAWELVTNASYQPAAIVVDTTGTRGTMRPIWQGLTQGHESNDMSFAPVVGLLKNSHVAYIRIDHLYDGYDVVGRGADGRLTYDWSKLDVIVGQILASGAVPYFSVSYMPSAISQSDILDVPKNWGEWAQVVSATVARYSRDYHGGIPNVIYEVWNEPDLFGGWKAAYSGKNYQQLYTVASNAAVAVKGTKPFQIGGPATTGFYPAWVNGFYDTLDSSVRIDFFSYHLYSSNLEDFVNAAKLTQQDIAPKIARAQNIYISEFGISSEQGKQYDGMWAGAHYLAVNRALEDSVIDMVMPFEIMDGPQGGAQFHGGWGMLTNPAFGAVAEKPRFHAFQLLSRLTGTRLPLVGEGTYVTALSARDASGTIRVLAVNYDQAGTHSEIFPITLTGLAAGTYTVQEEYLSGRTLKVNVTVTDGTMKRNIVLNPSDAVLVSVVR